jgi:hypothetical protein
MPYDKSVTVHELIEFHLGVNVGGATLHHTFDQVLRSPAALTSVVACD